MTISSDQPKYSPYKGYFDKKEKLEVSIIIPIKTIKDENLDNFIEYINTFAQQIREDCCQIVIANESPCDVFKYMDFYIGKYSHIIHFIPSYKNRDGDNDKLNGIYSALEYIVHDKILLLDDHFRITRDTLVKLTKSFDEYDCFKTMPNFDNYSPDVLIDMCGLFFVNITDFRKQYCGHLAFRKEHISKIGFPNRDALFDEFTIENHFRRHKYSIGFIKDLSIEATQKISQKKFFEQRIRYAYENLALPIRFIIHAIILPVLIILLIVSPKFASVVTLMITFGVLIITLIGQLIYGRGLVPSYTFLYSPVWFWFYPFTSWIALYKYITGGVNFGGKKVKIPG
ncbi:glycosyltransferase [Paenibacillus macerans]|uniref:Glycosyltransferase n=1 Tax=Paenibacillus macerans TaxID=44252 RepID=A0A090ZIL5_PAEMA|nr:glycosyltransferase family 2 protein [Paenibacillus macerans]KFN11174.1 hypothetical protein DJ90_2531 [Paenibacillus macerans]MCY7560212.1 glycosyltransferase family 2 protein [Paenibacillus macerans]MEC0151266.1 glycosyltransferase family 2 protein [Paenibacillus macerans]SUD26831.1 Uncharacterised protein [Paenibacillus macerans]